ncbi:MAG: hypothetical protein AAFR37_20855, partial [Cyanobacteria bacterium J06628_3]
MESQVILKKPVVKPKIHFQFIDGLRGFGAFWVVLRHSDPDGRISFFRTLATTLPFTATHDSSFRSIESPFLSTLGSLDL